MRAVAPVPSSPKRARIIACARSWIGTPYRHQASCRGAGADCLGLVRGVYAEIVGRPAVEPPPYSRDWAEALGRETLIEAATQHLIAVPPDQMLPGDVIVFRFRPAAPAKHTAILTSPDRFVHAIEGARACEVALTPWWRRRLAAVFAFPDVE